MNYLMNCPNKFFVGFLYIHESIKGRSFIMSYWLGEGGAGGKLKYDTL